MWDEGGPRALRSQVSTSLPRLSEKQFAQWEGELAKGPAARGWEDQRWTLDRVETVIGRFPLNVGVVPAGQNDIGRGAVPVDDQMVLAAGAGPVDRRRSDVSFPLSALTSEPSTAASSMSSRPTARNSARRTLCRRGQTPASVQSLKRYQAATSLLTALSADTSDQLTPLRST